MRSWVMALEFVYLRVGAEQHLAQRTHTTLAETTTRPRSPTPGARTARLAACAAAAPPSWPDSPPSPRQAPPLVLLLDELVDGVAAAAQLDEQQQTAYRSEPSAVGAGARRAERLHARPRRRTRSRDVGHKVLAVVDRAPARTCRGRVGGVSRTCLAAVDRAPVLREGVRVAAHPPPRPSVEGLCGGAVDVSRTCHRHVAVPPRPRGRPRARARRRAAWSQPAGRQGGSRPSHRSKLPAASPKAAEDHPRLQLLRVKGVAKGC